MTKRLGSVFMCFWLMVPFMGAAQESEDPSIQRAQLKSRQQEAMYRFETLLDTLDSASENIKATDPKASQRLTEAAKRLRQHQLMGRMDEIVACLSSSGRKFTAEKVSAEVAADLKAALELLTLDEDELLSRAVESINKALDEAIAAQKALDESGLQGPEKEGKQKELMEKAEKISKDMKALESELGEGGKEAMGLMQEAKEAMSQNAPSPTSEQGQEARKKMQEAKEALKKASEPKEPKDNTLEALRQEVQRLIEVQDAILATLQGAKGNAGRAALKKIEGLKATYGEQMAALAKLAEAFNGHQREPLADEAMDVSRFEAKAQGLVPNIDPCLPPSQEARHGLEDILEALKDLEPVSGDGGGGGGGGGGGAGPPIPDITQAILICRQQKRALRHTEAELPKEALEQQAKALARLESWGKSLANAEIIKPTGQGMQLIQAISGLQDKMRISKEGLAKPDTSEVVRVPQREVIRQLEEWIEQSRPKESEPSPSEPEPGPPSGGPPAAGSPGPEGDMISDNPTQGAKQSKLRRGSNQAGELRKFVEAEVMSSWGKLPQKEKDKMVRLMREKIPPAQARWIEEFSRRLAEGEAE